MFFWDGFPLASKRCAPIIAPRPQTTATINMIPVRPNMP